MPETVTIIDSHAFAGCMKITQIDVSPNVRTVELSAFECCGIKSIILPDGMTEIGGYAFSHCKDLVSMDIPSSITSIGKYAFFDCDQLVVHCPTGSYAEQYCIEQKIPFDNQMGCREHTGHENTASMASDTAKQLGRQPTKMGKASAHVADERYAKNAAPSSMPQYGAAPSAQRPAATPAWAPAPAPGWTPAPTPAPAWSQAQTGDPARKAEYDRLVMEKNALEQELSTLGFFKFSRKKEIRSRLAEIEALLRGQ